MIDVVPAFVSALHEQKFSEITDNMADYLELDEKIMDLFYELDQALAELTQTVIVIYDTLDKQKAPYRGILVTKLIEF